MSIAIRSFSSVSDIPSSVWDSIVAEEELFGRHSFLEIIEKSGVESASYQYLLFYDRDELVGHAVLSVFTIDLSLFLGKSQIIGWLKRWFPRLFSYKLLVCGTPLSAGHRNLFWKDADFVPAIVAQLTQHMEARAKAENLTSAVVKELYDYHYTDLNQPFADAGFFFGHSLPTVVVDVQWASFKAYLADMRATYRRQIKASLAKLGMAEPLLHYGLDIEEDDEPRFEVLEASEIDPEAFFELYTSIMSRAEVKLETLNQAFFIGFFAKMGIKVKAIRLWAKGKSQGMVVIAHTNRTLTWIWAGKDTAKNEEFDNYFNLVAAIVQYAIEHGCTTINLGQTAYYTKQRMGGSAQPLSLYFRSYKPFKHLLLKSLSSVIFPLNILPVLKVFK